MSNNTRFPGEPGPRRTWTEREILFHFWTSGKGRSKRDVRLSASRFFANAQARHPSLASLSAAGLVEPDGIEPTTSCLQSRRSPN